MPYTILLVSPQDKEEMKQVDALIEREGIKRDANLDYTFATYDGEGRIVATGSCLGDTLRCFAVDAAHQSEGLLADIVLHLQEILFARNRLHLFLYTKIKYAKTFGSLGFYEIARVDRKLVFMENQKTGFSDWLKELAKDKPTAPRIAAVVMNANPFTLGHQYLVETAAAKADVLHVFVVSEDTSLIPFSVRMRLVQEGTAHLPNVLCHPSGPYIISNATFPSYFLKDETEVIKSHALLDLQVFLRIAQAMDIKCRFVGDEPTSRVTSLYNQMMCQALPAAGIDCCVIPRLERDGKPISASKVRQLIHDGSIEKIRSLVPETTYTYFLSTDAKPINAHIRGEKEVAHY